MWTLRASDGPWFVAPIDASVAVPTTMLPTMPYCATERSADAAAAAGIVTVLESGVGSGAGSADVVVTDALIMPLARFLGVRVRSTDWLAPAASGGKKPKLPRTH